MRPALICTPLLVEQAALGSIRRRVRVVRTGMGPRRSTASAAALAGAAQPVLVAGVAGSLCRHVRPGDVVVASEVRTAQGTAAPSPSAGLLVDALRRIGLRVHLGPVVSTERPVDGAGRTVLAGTGALAVDMETAQLVSAATGGPFAAVRTIVDTPDHPLWRPGTVARGVIALWTLRRAAPALVEWAESLQQAENAQQAENQMGNEEQRSTMHRDPMPWEVS